MGPFSTPKWNYCHFMGRVHLDAAINRALLSALSIALLTHAKGGMPMGEPCQPRAAAVSSGLVGSQLCKCSSLTADRVTIRCS